MSEERKSGTVALSARLRLILSLVRPSRGVLDLGSDHALLPLALLEGGYQGLIRASEKSEGPFRNMRAAIEKAGALGRIMPVMADGLDALGDGIDQVVIAGLGGRTLAGIISAGAGRLGGVFRLIAEPQSDFSAARESLAQAGYRIVSEDYVREHGHIYPVMAAERGSQTLTPCEAEYGPLALRARDPLLKELLDRQLAIAEKVCGNGQADASLLCRLRLIREGLGYFGSDTEKTPV